MSTSTGQNLKVHQAIARALADNGVDTLFGLVGDANMFLCDSFVRDYGGKFVAGTHEVGATLMALGYAAISGKVGVCSVTHGAAMVNTVTALVQGVKSSTPLVVLCGDTKVEDRENVQNVAQRDFAIVAGAGFEQLRSPKTAVRDVATSIRRALVERRPIVLNVPYEFDWSDVEYQPVKIRLPEHRSTVLESEDIDNAVGIIAGAKRPVVIAGRGAMSPEARASIVALAKRIEAPLATTRKARDLFRGEDYNLGICGTESSPVAVDTIVGSDCLIFFGASITKYTTSLGTFVKNKRIIQVNQEPGEIGKNVLPDAGLVGNPGRVADLIVHWLNEAEIPSSGSYSEELKQQIAADVPVLDSPADYDNGTVDIRHALVRLDKILPEKRILVTDAARFVRQSWKILSTSSLGSFLPAIDFGSIGLGFSHGVGAAFAAKDRTVVVVAGDGGFMHGGLIEFNTAVRYGLNLIVVVGNDGSYGSEHIKFVRRSKDPGLSLFAWPELAPLAVAMGGSGVTVRSERDWAEAEAAIKNLKGPLLIDVKLDPDRISGED